MVRIILLIIIFCCTTCNRVPQQENIIFVDIDKPQSASLFDYFRFIELIPLETNANVLLTNISKLISHQDRYYALDRLQAIVFVFDKDGRYLFKIDKRGNGPGEYSSVEDININLFTSHLEFLSAYGFINKYDLLGNHIEMKRISYSGFRAVHQFTSINHNTHVLYSMFQPKKILYFDIDNNKLLHDEFEESQEIGSFAFDNLYTYNNDWYFFRPFHPCVYKIGEEGLEEFFRFDFGEYTREGTKAMFSIESRHNLKKLGEEAFEQFPYWIRKIGHNNKYILAQVPWKNVDDRSYIVYDKSAQKGKFIRDFIEKIDFEPRIVTDEYMLSWCNWSDIEKYVTKEMLNDAQKDIFERLIHAEMETNPILIKYYFK